MGKIKSRDQRRAAFIEIAGEMYDEMGAWYEEHPEASFGVISHLSSNKKSPVYTETLILLAKSDLGSQL
jgi:hypothetical protein